MLDVIVVIADRDRENLLCFVLLNDKAVEVRLDVARQLVEDENVIVIRAFLCRVIELCVEHFDDFGWRGKRGIAHLGS
jgi:hypothetical protein